MVASPEKLTSHSSAGAHDVGLISHNTAQSASATYNFVLIHGAWHTNKIWIPLEHELEHQAQDQDYSVNIIAPELPAGDVTATFDTDTDVVEAAIEGLDNLVLVSHSRGVETIPRLLSRIALSRVECAVILNSGGPHGFRPRLPRGVRDLARYSREFKEAKIDHADGSTELKLAYAKELLYQDVIDEALIRQAIADLRAQRNPNAAKAFLPPLPTPDELRRYVVLGKHDKVLNLERARLVSRQWAGVEPIELNSGHTPQLSQYAHLAHMLLDMATGAYPMSVSTRN